MTNRIWIALAITAVLAAYGFGHQAQSVAPKPSGVLFK
jgi:hypothetical protein